MMRCINFSILLLQHLLHNKKYVILTITLLVDCYITFSISSSNTPVYRDSSTEQLYQSLKRLCQSDMFLFGVPNALTISYNGGPKHPYIDQSDCKDITGSHPAFIESDFEWYVDPKFKRWDIAAMKIAYSKGAVLGYCYHLRGLKSNEFYTFTKDNKKSADSTLVKDILANRDRKTNESLDWYLTRLDTLVIPVFKELGFPLIFRPFHEMTGNWFWWGTATCTPDEFIQLYRLTVDYIRSQGVKNILYAWSPDKSTDMSFYPGDNYVDIIGYDGYEVGIADYHPIDLFVANVSTLSKIAREKNKVFAITEVGLYSLTSYPQYWTKHVFEPLKKANLLNQIAWIMTWYNADWNHDSKGVSYIPYKGIEKKNNGKQAIDDFITFYNLPQTIFLNDNLPFYSQSNELFVFPQKLELNINETYRILGGEKCCWMNKSYNYKSSNPKIATVDSEGTIKAITKGNATIILSTSDGRQARVFITVK